MLPAIRGNTFQGQWSRALGTGPRRGSRANVNVRYSSTVRVAVRVVPLYVAEILAEVEMRTMDVFTVNVALVAPAGMNTLDGTLAVPLLLERMTLTPPAGAGALSVTLPVEDCTPPMTVLGFKVSEDSVGGGGGGGFTVSEAVLVTPAKVAEIVTVVDALTALVLTVNVALVAPSATVTLEGTVATDVSLLESATCAPPDGAGPLSVTMPVEEFPPVTLVGLNVREVRVGVGGAVGFTVSEAVLVTPA